MTRTILTSLFLVSLAACGGSDPADKSTTKLDAVEVQPGTISDSMIILDNAAHDGTAIDNEVPADGTKKDAAKPTDDAADKGAADEAAKEADESDTADAVPAPATKKSVPEKTE